MQPSPRARRILRGLRAVAFVVGVGAFALLVHTVGWAGIESAIAHVGIGFLAIALIDLGSMFCDAAELYCFVRTQQRLAFWRVFAAQASGMAINRLTPTNSLGEPLKVTLLMEDVPEATAVSAVLMFNLTTMLVATTTIAIGVPLTILMLDIPAELQLIIGAAVVGLVAIVVTVLVIVRRGALGAVIGALRRIRILSPERAERWTARSAAIDANLRKYGDTWSKRAIAFAAGSRVCSWIGTIVLLHAAGIELTAPLVLGVLTIGQLLMWLSNIIPFGIGLYDSGSYALYGALGATGAEGMGFAMVNRVRTCVVALIGLSVMFVANFVKRRRA